MARPLIHPDFLLQNAFAEELYHHYAANLPIIDYHSHLPAVEIADDKQYSNLAQLWLHGDHYKWRAMRTNGVPELYCTGDASDWEKFAKWAETVPYTLRNPLFHWTHLELNRPFGINDRLLNPDTARGIWDEVNVMLAEPAFSCRGIIGQMKVELICTTNDPLDSLEAHRRIASDTRFLVRVLPTFRPDSALAVDNPAQYNRWLDELESVTDIDIATYGDLLDALENRHDFFHEHGCRLSDHGLDTAYGDPYTGAQMDAIFLKVRDGQTPGQDEIRIFRSGILHALFRMNHTRDWAQQIHLGAMRNNNSRLFTTLGPDIGCDSIGDLPIAESLSRMLDRLDNSGELAKTILYNLNPRDNAVLATMAGNFQDGSFPGKIQYGSGWWFLDQKDGMERQLEDLSNLGLLSRFIGMLTDSRSFLSFTRHEYFRRILCNLLGRDMEQGLIPSDIPWVGNMVKDICYHNAGRYLSFDNHASEIS